MSSEEVNDQEIPQERITVYNRQDKHRKLKAKLAIKGLTVSEWFRRKTDEELALPY